MTLPRLYPILDTASLARRDCAVETAARAMLEGGARILQFRHKGPYSRAVFEEAERVAELSRRAGALFVIDDRADIALLLDAGLHVGQDDLPPQDARRLLGPGRLLGFSTHNGAQFAAALEEPADYLAFGPIFSTASKENPDPAVGLETLRGLRADRVMPPPPGGPGGISFSLSRAVVENAPDKLKLIPQGVQYSPEAEALPYRPVVAIGGIRRAHALAVLAAGADSLAVINDLLPETCTFETLRARMEEWQRLVRA